MRFESGTEAPLAAQQFYLGKDWIGIDVREPAYSSILRRIGQRSADIDQQIGGFEQFLNASFRLTVPRGVDGTAAGPTSFESETRHDSLKIFKIGIAGFGLIVRAAGSSVEVIGPLAGILQIMNVVTKPR